MNGKRHGARRPRRPRCRCCVAAPAGAYQMFGGEPANAILTTEYHNAAPASIFVTVSAEEVSALDGGSAPGWARTDAAAFYVIEHAGGSIDGGRRDAARIAGMPVLHSAGVALSLGVARRMLDRRGKQCAASSWRRTRRSTHGCRMATGAARDCSRRSAASQFQPVYQAVGQPPWTGPSPYREQDGARRNDRRTAGCRKVTAMTVWRMCVPSVGATIEDSQICR